ncbi:MAG: HupE/UreJ family protein [Cytophagales bacterium]|nr:MAG: HupE/UreJ family protein [Cytophagales bacterium]
MPNSVVLLRVHADRIEADVQIPLGELQSAFGHAVNDSSAGLINRLGPQLRAYLQQHIRAERSDGRPWHVVVAALSVQETQNALNGVYRELVAEVRLVPPTGADVRRFTFRYDAVVHQVVTHSVLVSVKQDWAGGVLPEAVPANVGIIALDIPSNTIRPLIIDLKTGSVWTGFRTMVNFGMRHIAEGTDHLLFLLVLLLPAPLRVNQKQRWGPFGGIRYSLIRLLRIVTAFTLGHSLTLLAGALNWVRLPGQPVEILIAVSILVSALHAVRPLFAGQGAVGREGWIAAGFGLVHGLAFANTLTNLQLDAGPMALSILGFNVGIELMQLFIITLVFPGLILLSRTPAYRVIRLAGAMLAAIAAVAWVFERVSGEANWVTMWLITYAPEIPSATVPCVS